MQGARSSMEGSGTGMLDANLPVDRVLMKLHLYFSDRTGTVLAMALCGVLTWLGGLYPAQGEIISPDRRITWQAGVRGGIPNRTTIFCNVKVSIPGSTNRAYGDNLHDDTDAIYDAINNCPSNQVVFLPQGTYKITRRLSFGTKSGVTIRGEGQGKTTISAALTNSANSIFLFGASEWVLPADRTKNITGGLTKGSTSLTLSDTVGLSMGNLLLVDQLNDTNLVRSRGSGGTVVFADRPHDGTRVQQQMVKITAISGNQVTITPPLCWTMTPALLPQASRMLYTLRRTGFEDLTIENVTGMGGNFFYFDTAEDCWIKNVESKMVHATHIFLYQSLNCEIRDNYIHDAHRYTVNAGYGIEIRKSTGVLVENNILYHLYSSLMINSGSVGCVIGYNYIYKTQNYQADYMIYAISASHGAHPMMNLYEGNVGNRFQSDFYWGSSSHQTVFRNHWTGNDVGITQNRSAISIDGHSLSNNVVGNVLGSPEVSNWIFEQTTNAYSHSDNVVYRLGFPNMGNNSYSPLDPQPFYPAVKSTMVRHGNFDFSRNTTEWSPSISDRTIPTSLYLSSKPAWWGNNRWPAIGPDLNPMLADIPAETRFDALLVEAARKPSAPQNLRLVSP